jgi:hypothetical protein
MMGAVRARRALVETLLRRRSARGPQEPPAFWGRIGSYEAVTRGGVLFLLAPEPTHPSRRATSGA